MGRPAKGVIKHPAGLADSYERASIRAEPLSRPPSVAVAAVAAFGTLPEETNPFRGSCMRGGTDAAWNFSWLWIDSTTRLAERMAPSWLTYFHSPKRPIG